MKIKFSVSFDKTNKQKQKLLYQFKITIKLIDNYLINQYFNQINQGVYYNKYTQPKF